MELKEIVRDMDNLFDKNVQPLIDSGNYSQAYKALEEIETKLIPHAKKICGLSYGVDYFVSIGFILDFLYQDKKPGAYRMKEYRKHSSKVGMEKEMHV